MKIAVISVSLPPVQSGQAIVLYRLLKDLDPADYCLITQKNAIITHFGYPSLEKLPGRCYNLSPDNEIVRKILLNPISVKISPVLDAFLKIRTHQIRQILIKEKCDVVLSCTADLFDPPAAFIASKSLGIPFIFYLFDDYINQWPNLEMQRYAKKYEECLIKQASHVIVPNEALCNEYERRYEIMPKIIHNPVDIELYEAMSLKHKIAIPDGKRIVYTGAIYNPHYDAFRNLLDALVQIDQPELKLHIYTDQFDVKLKKSGIVGPVVIHKNLPNTCMPAIQRSANILFLPLGFKKTVTHLVNTSAPGKMGEYLAARKPVLVHAPPDSFISWYFNKFDCGIVVNRDDPKILAQAILCLFNNADLQKRISENAYSRASLDFNVKDAQEKFNKILKSSIN